MRKIIFLIIFILSFCSIVHGQDEKVKKIKAIEIADKEAIKLGYKIDTMDMEISLCNVPWNRYLSKARDDEYAVSRKNKLKNRKYWAIYYAPRHKESIDSDEIIITAGGDVCIFIDADTGEVITNYRGK